MLKQFKESKPGDSFQMYEYDLATKERTDILCTVIALSPVRRVWKNGMNGATAVKVLTQTRQSNGEYLSVSEFPVIDDARPDLCEFVGNIYDDTIPLSMHMKYVHLFQHYQALEGKQKDLGYQIWKVE